MSELKIRVLLEVSCAGLKVAIKHATHIIHKSSITIEDVSTAVYYNEYFHDAIDPEFTPPASHEVVCTVAVVETLLYSKPVATCA